MTEYRSVLERAGSNAPQPDLQVERVLRRRDRKHRNQRIRAGALGLAIAIAVGWLGVNAIRSTPPVPADDATPPEGLGIFAPVAGRIVYGNTEGDRSYLWAVDPSGPSDTTEGPSVAGDVASTRVRLPQDALPPDLWTTPLGWSSDGTELLFKRGYGEECCFPEEYLYILHADGSETQLNSEPIFFTEYSATISPDGTRVVFAAQGDLSGLYVIDAEGGRPVPLGIPHAWVNSPTFSPDGTKIAYLEGKAAGNVWVMNADGTNAHEILANVRTGSGLQWSPAGDRLAIGLGAAIYTLAPDGSDFTKVITGGSSPYWSPDGSQIAYTISCFDYPNGCGLTIADADGSNVLTFGFASSGPWHPAPITSDEPPPVPADDPTPTPASVGTLAYALDGDIFVANPDGSNAVQISHYAPDARCEGLSEETYLSWSPDGRYLAFQRDCPSSEQDDMVITDPHGNVVGEFPTYGGGWGFTWSPDSTRIAVWEPALTIGVYGIDGERQASFPTSVITGGGNDDGPGWMPDGSALLFGYAVVPLDGGAGYELSLGGLDPSLGGQATYSPDGTRVAVVRGNSITVLDAEGSLVSEVDGRLDGVDAWSPEGEHFASLSHGELNVVDAASGSVTELPEATAALDGGDEILGIRGFSPQGDRILFATSDGSGGRRALYSIGVDGSDAHLVVAGTWEGDWFSPIQAD